MFTASSLYRVPRPAWASVLLGLGVGLLPTVAVPQASTRWVVEPRTSLAWWQVNPTLNHLWATTCTADRGWRPGEGRSSGWDITSGSLKLPKTGYANVSDTVHVPLYPRLQVHGVCQQAVSGHIDVADTVHWRGIHGLVVVRVAALTTGEAMRDEMMREILNATQYQDFLFRLDSVVDLTKVADTLVGRAVGMLTVRAIPRPLTAAVKAFPDSGGMRVLAKFRIPANDLHDYTPSINSVGLGVNTKLWKDFFFGIDIVLRPPDETAGD
jgi:hypothetical protein